MAVVKTFTVSVSDGELDILFESLVGRAMVSAIEVLPLTGLRIMEKPEAVNKEEGSVLIAFPNPFNDKLAIQLPGYPKEVHVSITDLQGMVKYKENHISENQSLELELSFLSSGFYIINVEASGMNSKTLRLLKQ